MRVWQLGIKLCGILLLLIFGGVSLAQVSVIRTASLKVETSKGTTFIPRQELPFRWDSSFPGENGRATFELTLPSKSTYAVSEGSQRLFALYAPRAGNQVQAWLNGQAISVSSDLDDTTRDFSQTPLWLTIPAQMLLQDQPNRLQIRTSMQALRWGGLSEISFGLERDLCNTVDMARLWQQISYVVILVSQLLMGLLSALIWLRQRENLYRYFAWSALTGCVVCMGQLLTQHYLPWPVQGIVAAVALAWHVIFMSRFALEIVGRHENWVSLSMLASTLAVGIAYVLAEPVYWTITVGLLCLPIFAALVCTARAADAQGTGQARALFAVSLIVAMVAIRDFFMVQWPQSGMNAFILLPHALFLFVLVMGRILVTRYTEQHRLYRELNITLEDRISQREQQLAQTYQRVQAQGEERAKLLERQRIMQDIHDGVGGQLVGLVNMMKRGESQPAQLQEHAQMALDELRVAIDAMQPVDGDLSTVLATLRYRLEPRLKATGIHLVWQVDELPTMLDLTPQKVLQIQKILLEAFTNVMRHARANEVVVCAQYHADAARIAISIADNGVGFEPNQLTAPSGHGLRNMQFRAEAIGAQLTLSRGLPEGAVLTLQMPLPLA